MGPLAKGGAMITVLCIFAGVWGVAGLFAVGFWLRMRWACRRLGISALELSECRTKVARQVYFKDRYSQESASIKLRVVSLLRRQNHAIANQIADLLLQASEPGIYREESSTRIVSLGPVVVYRVSQTNMLHIELVGPAAVVHVGNVPSELLKDVDNLERAADILGVE